MGNKGPADTDYRHLHTSSDLTCGENSDFKYTELSIFPVTF